MIIGIDFCILFAVVAAVDAAVVGITNTITLTLILRHFADGHLQKFSQVGKFFF